MAFIKGMLFGMFLILLAYALATINLLCLLAKRGAL
jgi:hypothetical protein